MNLRVAQDTLPLAGLTNEVCLRHRIQHIMLNECIRLVCNSWDCAKAYRDSNESIIAHNAETMG